MTTFKKILIIVSLFFLVSCSSSYQKLTNLSVTPPNKISEYLLKEYEEKANFEAIEMHDWNSAKLYSEKALSASKGNKILPQKIDYWKIIPEKSIDLIKAYNNLMDIYEQSISSDPKNLAKAISSLDCWAEQQEENWQIWDINKCRDDYLNAMHAIFDNIHKKKICRRIR